MFRRHFICASAVFELEAMCGVEYYWALLSALASSA